MKKLFLFLGIAALGVSCSVEDNKQPSSQSTKVDFNNIAPFVVKQAPVQEGYTTIILADQDTVCTTNVAMKYLFPKGAEETIKYVPSSKDVIFGGTNNVAFMAGFEDSRIGDNDYNDFVCYIKVIGGWDENLESFDATVQIYPIASGAAQVVQFGILLPNGQKEILSTNVKNDFFPYAEAGKNFINTLGKEMETTIAGTVQEYTYNIQGLTDFTQGISPFIVNTIGDTLYTIISGNTENLNYNSLVSATDKPLGIASSKFFKYPIEFKSALNCYTTFGEWIEGNATSMGEIVSLDSVVNFTTYDYTAPSSSK
ncbi:MAG: hypothetical protein LBM25_00140 [Bacteroidales bacterium]|jgi:hypothetical protein|nr:hypothetical protein [Bacteroidales bacterium]